MTTLNRYVAFVASGALTGIICEQGFGFSNALSLVCSVLVGVVLACIFWAVER